MEQSLTAERFEALVAVAIAAGRGLQRALLSLDPDHVRAARELATFLLGMYRTLETLDAAVLIAWRQRLTAVLDLDVMELCRRTGEPAFMEPGFLAFLRASEELEPPRT